MPLFSSPKEIEKIIADLPQIDFEIQKKATIRQGLLTKPINSLGILEDIAIWLAGWQRTEKPNIKNGHCLIFAGNHGVVAQNISPFPQEVTNQMVQNFQTGGAAINQLCRVADLNLHVIPMQLEEPTNDFTTGPAMKTDEVLLAMNSGAEAIPDHCDYLVLGEMGIGNTTSAAALCLCQFGGIGLDWVGPGTGLDQNGVKHKAMVIEKALTVNQPIKDNLLSLLKAFGGRELAAIAGAVLAARIKSIPVMLDGFITTAAAAVLTAKGRFGVLDHTLISHISSEPGHLPLAIKLNKEPIFDLRMCLGEASGAAVATLLVRAACATHNDMATFSEAGVSARASG